MNLNKEINDLVEEFKRVAKKRWIKSEFKSFGSIGLTFEKELRKNPDAMYFPDFEGIEIKCVSSVNELIDMVFGKDSSMESLGKVILTAESI